MFKLTANLFFNILLPPIILDAAFGLYSRDFLANSLNIFVYAVLGTVANILLIGFSLYGLGQADLLGEKVKELKPVQAAGTDRSLGHQDQEPNLPCPRSTADSPAHQDH